ncbi:MAG: hypothetical protein ACKOTZ_11500 [Chloroflexota bacterium]
MEITAIKRLGSYRLRAEKEQTMWEIYAMVAHARIEEQLREAEARRRSRRPRPVGGRDRVARQDTAPVGARTR